MTKEIASLCVQIAAMICAFAYGLIHRNKRIANVCISLGIGADVVGQILIAGGGPGAAAGLLLLPIYALIAGALGQLLRRRVIDRYSGSASR